MSRVRHDLLMYLSKFDKPYRTGVPLSEIV